MFNYPRLTVLVEEPAFASYGFGGRAGLQAGVKTRNHEGFSPSGERPPGLKASSRGPERGPEGPLFHGGANTSRKIRKFLEKRFSRKSRSSKSAAQTRV